MFELRRMCGLPMRDGGNSVGVAMKKKWSMDVDFARDAQNVRSRKEVATRDSFRLLHRTLQQMLETEQGQVLGSDPQCRL